MNEKGTKTSFLSQVQLLKFIRIFSEKYSRQFLSYLPNIKSYPKVILLSYHPINTQIIAYGLSLLSDFAWRFQPQKEEDSLIYCLEKHKIQHGLESFLSPFVESIIDSDSIVNVYHNLKFINELMASVVCKKDKELLQQNLSKMNYTMVLQNVKLKLQTMQYSIEKTTFIAVYQKIFKYSLRKQGMLKQQRPNLDAIIEENFRNSVLAQNNSRNSLQLLHQQAIATLIKAESEITSQDYIQQSNQNKLVTYLNENDRRQFNKLIFDTLTEMQKFYKLEFYLQTTTFAQNQQSLQIEAIIDQNKAKQFIDSRIIEHNIETYFNKIKQQCTQNKSIDILITCIKKLSSFKDVKQWQALEKWLFQDSKEIKKVEQQNQKLKNELQQKQNKIKTLLKENNDLKNKLGSQNPSSRKNSENVNQNAQNHFLKPPPSLQESLKLSVQNNQSTSSKLLIPPPPLPPLPIGLPFIPVFNLGIQLKQKAKRQPPKPLKACNYTTIAYEKIKNSIFQQIDDTKIHIDENQLVQLFAKNAENQGKLKRASSLENIVTVAEGRRLTLPQTKVETVQLLRPDRSKNIEIVLTKLKIPKGEFKKALIECNGGKWLSQHTLEAIEKILPTQQEEQLVNAYDGYINNLGVPQRFFKQLIQVPQYGSRIKSIIFSHVNQQLYFEISSKMSQLQAGFISLKQNSRLKCVIETCLAIGNYLNGQSVKGGAWGFRLDTIQRLEEVKSADGKMNGALYLIKQLWKQFQYPLFDREEIDSYHYLAKMPLSQVKNEIDELQNYVKSIEKAMRSKNENDENDSISKFCSNFSNQALQKLNLYREKFTLLKQLFIKCATYYCEESKTLATDEFGKKMYQCILFVSNTQKIYKAINDQNLKSSKFKATQNSVVYNESDNPQKLTESLIEIRQILNDSGKQKQNLNKMTPSILNDGNKPGQRVSFRKNEGQRISFLNESQIILPITHNQRASQRLSYIFQIHKPAKPLQELTFDEIQTQLKAIQRQSVNRAMEDVLMRRTMKFQNINARLSKVNTTLKQSKQ